MEGTTTLGDILGTSLEENFIDFDMTLIREILNSLAQETAYDLPQAEMLQQKALQGADIISDYLCKLVKTVSYLETKVNSTKNNVSLHFEAKEGRTTSEMKKWAGESSSLVENIQIQLSTAKGAKSLLEKKYDILIKTHHHYKDIATGLRKTVLGYAPNSNIPEGYE
jgi:hypothetical protein